MRITPFVAKPYREHSIAELAEAVRAFEQQCPAEASAIAGAVLSRARAVVEPYCVMDTTSAYPGSVAADYAATRGVAWRAGEAEPGYDAAGCLQRGGCWYPALIVISEAVAANELSEDVENDPQGAVRMAIYGRWLTELSDLRDQTVTAANAAAVAAEEASKQQSCKPRKQLRMCMGTFPHPGKSADPVAAGLIRRCVAVYHAVKNQVDYTAWRKAAITDPTVRLDADTAARLLKVSAVSSFHVFRPAPVSARLSSSLPLLAELCYWLVWLLDTGRVRADDDVDLPQGEKPSKSLRREFAAELCGGGWRLRRALASLRASGWGASCSNGFIRFTAPDSGVSLESCRWVYLHIYQRVIAAGGSATAASVACCLLHRRRNGQMATSLFAVGCHVWGHSYRTYAGGGRQALRVREAMDWLVANQFAEACDGNDKHGSPTYCVVFAAYLPESVPAELRFCGESVPAIVSRESQVPELQEEKQEQEFEMQEIKKQESNRGRTVRRVVRRRKQQTIPAAKAVAVSRTSAEAKQKRLGVVTGAAAFGAAAVERPDPPVPAAAADALCELFGD